MERLAFIPADSTRVVCAETPDVDPNPDVVHQTRSMELGARWADRSGQATAVCRSPAPPVQPMARASARTSARSACSSQTAHRPGSSRKPRTAESRSRSAVHQADSRNCATICSIGTLEGTIQPVVQPELHKSPLSLVELAVVPRRSQGLLRLSPLTSCATSQRCNIGLKHVSAGGDARLTRRARRCWRTGGRTGMGPGVLPRRRPRIVGARPCHRCEWCLAGGVLWHSPAMLIRHVRRPPPGPWAPNQGMASERLPGLQELLCLCRTPARSVTPRLAR